MLPYLYSFIHKNIQEKIYENLSYFVNSSNMSRDRLLFLSNIEILHNRWVFHTFKNKEVEFWEIKEIFLKGHI